MEDNKDLVVEETNENTDAQTVEEIEDTNQLEEEPVEEQEHTEEPEEQINDKKYSDEELDAIIKRKLARQESKLRREYDKKYSRLETVVNAGLGTENVEQATEKLEDFYTQNGVKIPEAHKYSEEETNLLANAEADEIIKSYTFKELVDEVDALADIGVDNMTERDKIVFMKLAKERQRQEEQKDLLSLGINKKDIEDSEFKEFSNKLNPELSLKEKYELFLQVKPKKETKKMGSMQSGATSKVKDYYTAEEIERLTDEDLDNDAVWEAVRKSMTGQA
ncbi:MAG: hypothetical protein MR691_14805 [Clostridium sp.]|nr:hypothetical protein [Clostridium sp.]